MLGWGVGQFWAGIIAAENARFVIFVLLRSLDIALSFRSNNMLLLQCNCCRTPKGSISKMPNFCWLASTPSLRCVLTTTQRLITEIDDGDMGECPRMAVTLSAIFCMSSVLSIEFWMDRNLMAGNTRSVSHMRRPGHREREGDCLHCNAYRPCVLVTCVIINAALHARPPRGLPPLVFDPGKHYKYCTKSHRNGHCRERPARQNGGGQRERNNQCDVIPETCQQ